MKSASFFLLAVSVSAQQLDETLIDRPAEGIDFPGCYSDLHKADTNGDGFVKANEFLNFVKTYGERLCFETDELTLQQRAVFNKLACLCSAQEGTAADCCIGDNAQISTAGAVAGPREITPNQSNYLTSVCKLTDATIGGQCAPVVRDRGEPLGAIVAPPPAGGTNNGLLWGLIAAAILLFLLCCCCCCVCARRRKKEEEEEEEEVLTKEEQMEKALPVEQAPMVPPGPHLLRSAQAEPENRDESGKVDPSEALNNGPGIGASGAAVAEDSDDEEEGRKRRGGGNIPPGTDDEGIRIPTAPRLPPPRDPENPPHNLRPIPPKESEDDEWDHPGRNIDFPKDKDEMSAGEYDHYEPDGGVNWPEREGKDPLNWKKDWNRQKPEEPDEVDDRKHRIQSGLGEQEVWNKLQDDTTETSRQAPKGDVFDWVVQSALGALDENDDQLQGDSLP